ncbi:MAG: DUF4905 domain-containing protein [Ignavibacteriaceae bacterium]
MKLKKKYTHNNKRQIFRLIPTNTGKIIIEERDTEKKLAFFNCLQIDSGKKIFKHLQLDEKFWLGIEAIYNDVIFFHKFIKPDLPQHNGIVAYDINQKRTIWEDKNRTFLFINDDKIYAFKQRFEDREFVTLNYITGEVIDELGIDSDAVNLLREEAINSEDFSSYHFPGSFNTNSFDQQRENGILSKLREEHIITGDIEYLLMDDLLLFNFHEVNTDNTLKNTFKAVDLSNEKCILELTLNSRTNAFAPDSFFVKDDLLFVLMERTKLEVFIIKN